MGTELQPFTLQWYGLGEFSAMLRDAGFPYVSVHADYRAGQHPADGSDRPPAPQRRCH